MMQQSGIGSKPLLSLAGCDSMQSLMEEFNGKAQKTSMSQQKFLQQQKEKRKNTLINNIENHTQTNLKLIKDEY